MMKKSLVFGLLAFMTLAFSINAEAGKGRAQNIDFGSYTCDTFLADLSTASEDDAAAIFLWLDGYLSGVSGDTVLDWRGFEEFTTKLVSRCQRHGNEQLLNAAQRVGID